MSNTPKSPAQNEQDSVQTWVTSQWKNLPEPGHFSAEINTLNFIWVFAFAGLVLLIELQGTPHLLVSYTYFGSREYKSSCDYFGLHSQSLSAVAGDCPFIQLLR